MADQLELLRAALADRYAVERVLGLGGSATVYLAKDLKLDRDVAIKVLRPEIAESVGAERFVREIKVTAHLQHPNIVPVTESGVAAGLIFFVLPYVQGETLRALLKRTPQLDVAEAVRLTREIADGLAYAHGEGIIHRDIKPENVLLSGGHAVITDFGLAKAKAAAGGDEHSTDSGIAVGTPWYMSPEQSSAAKDIDARTDQYALACVLYEMLAGEPPFTGPTAQAVAARHMQQPPPSIRIVRPGVSPAMAAVMERGLAKVPADRYKTVADFSAALANAVVEPSVRTPVLRRPRPRALLGAVVVLVAAWLAFESTRNNASSLSSPIDTHEPPRIAVLNLEAASQELTAFAANLTNRLTDALASIDPATLAVAPRRALAPYEKLDVPLDSITQALNIATFISGRVETERSRVRINLQLINGRTLRQIEAHNVSAELPDRQLLVDAVADTVMASLRRMLGPEIRKRRQALETKSGAAFDLVQEAEERLTGFDAQLEVPSLSAAHRTLNATDSLFAAAERLDPRWVEPIVGRGNLTYQRLLLAAAELASDAARQQVLNKGLEHAERAVKLAPDNPQALQLRGLLRYRSWKNYPPSGAARADALRDSAENDLRRALDGNPDRSRVLLTLGELVATSGRLEDALKYTEQAYASDPYLERADQILLRMFEYRFELARDSAAGAACFEGARRFPDQPLFYDCQLQLMAWSDMLRPDPGRARSLKDSALARYPPLMHASFAPHLEMLVGVIYARAGQRDSARAILNRGLAITPLGFGTVIPVVDLLTLLGEKDAAVKRVVAYAAANPDMLGKMRRSRGLSALRTEPRVMRALEEAPSRR